MARQPQRVSGSRNRIDKLFLLSAPAAIHRSAVSLLEGMKPIQIETLGQIKKPKHLVVGEMNVKAYPRKEMEELGLEYAVINIAGHAMMHDSAEDFLNKLFIFWKKNNRAIQ